MPVAEAHIATPRAERFLTQLCRHAEAMGGRHLHGGDGQARPEVLNVDYADNEGKIEFSWGACTLRSTSDTLVVRVEAGDAGQLGRIQGILSADLERFGKRDGLKVSWQGQEGTASESPVRRSRGTTMVLIVAAVLAVAAHVAFGGAALAAWRWTSVVADILLGLVILKIVVVALFARHRLRGHGRFTSGRVHRGRRQAEARRADPPRPTPQP
jgi:hypothetical protein